MSKTKQVFGTSHVPLSPAVRAGDLVYISGQVPTKDGKIVGRTIKEQTTQVLENVKAALALAGCTMDDVVKCLVILTDAKEFAEFNEVYATYFTEGAAGPHDARSEFDDRHQGRDRGDRL